MRLGRAIPPLVHEFVASASADARSDVVPFWQSNSEGVREEGMYLLALELDLPDTAEFLRDLPIGYRVVFNIFNWEQSRAGEGFRTGIENSGAELVAAAAQSYELVGMPEEAHALRHLLAQYELSPNDHAALAAAYMSSVNPYRDDWDRIPRVVRTLCVEADRYFYGDEA